jgi:hypothetical protein
MADQPATSRTVLVPTTTSRPDNGWTSPVLFRVSDLTIVLCASFSLWLLTT